MDGLELKRRRERAKLTQHELGQRLGLRPETISNYERGRRPIPDTVELALAKVLEEQGEQFSRTLEEQLAPYVLSPMHVSPEEMELVSLWRQIQPGHARRIWLTQGRALAGVKWEEPELGRLVSDQTPRAPARPQHGKEKR